MNIIKPIKNRKIKIALVGCGRISKNHIRAISCCYEACELLGLCDLSIPNLNAAKDNYIKFQNENNLEKIIIPRLFNSYQELLSGIKGKSIEIDLVIFCTPSGLHPEQVIEASKLGLHSCTEKPMATRWEDGIKMVKECEKASVHLFVVKQNRFNKTLQLIKKQLEKGRFGKLAMVGVNVFWQRPQSYYDQDSWRGTWAFDGGALMNQASHYVDLLDWLIGPVESINARIATLGREIEVEDTASLSLKWRNGALGWMAVTMLTYPKNLEGSITILGEKGSVKVGGLAVNKIEWWHFSDKDDNDDEVEKANYETNSVYGFGHLPYYENMLKTIKGESRFVCKGTDGLKSLEILIAAYRSSRDGSTIHLPLEY